MVQKTTKQNQHVDVRVGGVEGVDPPARFLLMTARVFSAGRDSSRLWKAAATTQLSL